MLRSFYMLAALGYTALALDMYGDGKQAHHPDDAGKFATEVSQNAPMAKARFDAAFNLLPLRCVSRLLRSERAAVRHHAEPAVPVLQPETS